MDAQWLGVMVAAAAVTVSLAALILSGLRGIREEVRSLSRQQREDRSRLEDAIASQTQQQRDERSRLEDAIASQIQQQREDRSRLEDAIASQTRQQRDDHAMVMEKLSEIAERTARIEGILVSQGLAEFHASAAQAVPDEPPD